jgi:ABC-type nitrate/sulfonate/bicarbonate transport system substrate-binding protein
MLAALALTLAVTAPGCAAEKLMVGKSGQKVFAFSLIDVGIRQGVFARHGLDVTTAEFQGGARMQQALAAGSLDIGFGGGTDFVAVSKGSPVKAIAVVSGAPYDFSITVKGSGPIRSVADLKGRKIGVTTIASLTYWLTGETARLQGWGPDGVNRVATGSAATSWALLRTGELEGFTGDLGNGLQYAQKSDGRVLVRVGEVIKDFLTFVVFARNDVMAMRPQAVRTFVAAWFDTLAYVRAHKAETVRITREILGHDEDIADRLYDGLVPTYSTDGRFPPKSLQVLARALKDQSGLAESTLAALYTEDFLPKR